MLDGDLALPPCASHGGKPPGGFSTFIHLNLCSPFPPIELPNLATLALERLCSLSSLFALFHCLWFAVW
jgi:hypothetical protein